MVQHPLSLIARMRGGGTIDHMAIAGTPDDARQGYSRRKFLNIGSSGALQLWSRGGLD